MHKGESEGQWQLINDGASVQSIQDATGVARATVARWKKAILKPDVEMRAMLEINMGIPFDSWDVKPAKGHKIPTQYKHIPEPVNAPKVRSARLHGEPLRAVPFPPYPKAPKRPTTLQEVRHSLACIRHDLLYRDYTAVARSKVRADEIRTLGIIHKLEISNEMKEDKYVNSHPRWRKLKRVMLEALEPYPEASEALLIAIQEEYAGE